MPQPEEEEIKELQVLIGKGEKGFKKWLDTLNQAELEKRVSDLELESTMKHEVLKYVDYVKSSETIQVCAKCEWRHGCEKCSYTHALRYALRHQKPSYWWVKAAGMALRERPVNRGCPPFMCIFT